MEVVILSGANSDLDDIYAQLGADERSDKFLGVLDRRLELLKPFPRMAPAALARKVRRLKVGRTPYGIFYTVESKRVMVIAIHDLRQDSETLAEKILTRL